jgi:hypothetical protein
MTQPPGGANTVGAVMVAARFLHSCALDSHESSIDERDLTNGCRPVDQLK